MKLPSIPQQYRPSKKFIISVSILAGATVLFFGIRYIANHVGPKNPLATVKVGELNNPASTDTDRDGLKDWEEALWGTDPKNPDTDANGVPDGRQVEQTRNTINQQGSDVTIPPEQLTETDKLARDIYTSLVLATQNGELSQTDSLALQSKIIEYIVRRTGDYKQYQQTDIIISGTSVTTYAAAVNAVNTSYKKTQSQLFQVIDELTKNTATPEIAAALAKQYNGLAEQLKNQPVPQYLASQHLELINALLQIGAVMQAVSGVENDPLIAFIHGIGLQDALTRLGNAFGDLGRALSQ